MEQSWTRTWTQTRTRTFRKSGPWVFRKDASEGSAFKYGNSFSKLLPKTTKQGILALDLSILLFGRNFVFTKIRERFQIWQYLFQIAAHKYPNKIFLAPNLEISVLPRNYAIRKIWGHSFQLWQKHFQIPAQKYSNTAFLVPNLRIFIFAPKFWIRQIRGHLFQIWW